ncbi:decapping and exoribonuclease protein [Ciona intestinalis]
MPSVKQLLQCQNPEECFLRKPTEAGRFSLDAERKFHHDRSAMSCFCPPVRNNRLLYTLDLNDGYNTSRFIKRDENVKEKLDNMLHWLLLNKNRFVTDERSANKTNVIGAYPDFVLWRGHLSKMMCTPFEKREGWEMAIQKMGKTIYISEVETVEAMARRANLSDRESLMTYWGVRFEGYMTGNFPKPGQNLKPKNFVESKQTVTNTNTAFCSVLRSRLNSRHSLIYGAEVDCCLPVEVVFAPDSYVELKTSRTFDSFRQENNFYKFKARKWWAQSFLAGVPQITCGFRDDRGLVTELCDFKTLELPSKTDAWNSQTCLVFLDNILQFIKEMCQDTNAHSVSKVALLKYRPQEQYILYEASDSKEFCFLPDWFVKAMRDL